MDDAKYLMCKNCNLRYTLIRMIKANTNHKCFRIKGDSIYIKFRKINSHIFS